MIVEERISTLLEIVSLVPTNELGIQTWSFLDKEENQDKIAFWLIFVRTDPGFHDLELPEVFLHVELPSFRRIMIFLVTPLSFMGVLVSNSSVHRSTVFYLQLWKEI